LLSDESITEIMVNGAKKVYIERQGKIERTNLGFESDDHLMRIIDRIVSPLGRRIDESSPYVDARLPDGSRVNAIIPPLALNGPTLTIRKFSRVPLTIDDLIRFGTITPEAIEFLKACVIARLNVIVSGGTGSGKTTFLNILSGFIPNDERIITVENAAELQLRQEHVVTLESRPANIEGRGEVTIRDLVVNCLRMRPDRIVVGECRSGEALDMLQAMNTGHDGSLTTAHSNSPRDTLARLETMVLMAGMDLPVRAIREQIASAVDLIVHQERMRDGSRKVVNITEVQGMEGDVIVMSDIFGFEQQGMEGGRVIGRLKPTGLRPKFVERFESANIHLPAGIFGVSARNI
jgi:pilus assembly protein CpaF